MPVRDQTKKLQLRTTRVLRDKGTSDPMAEEGRRAGLDRLDWDKQKALSKDSLDIDLGANSAMGADSPGRP